MSQLNDLESKIVLILGGTGLIGEAVTEGFLKAGATVIVGSRRPPKSHNETIYFLEADISKEESIKQFFEKAQKKWGRVDVFINCALPTPHSHGTWETLSSKDMLQDLKDHLVGYYNACRFALLAMRDQNFGSIINFGSIYGELAPDFRIYQDTEVNRLPTYSLIKAGVHNLTKYFAVLGAEYNVRVNTLAPGGVVDKHTPKFQEQYSARVPLKRMATPQDIVGSALFLASSASSYLTGQTLFVDGGLSSW